jgi:hypothetical protein
MEKEVLKDARYAPAPRFPSIGARYATMPWHKNAAPGAGSRRAGYAMGGNAEHAVKAGQYSFHDSHENL